MTDVKFSDFTNATNASYPTPVGLQSGANVQIPSNALAKAIQDAIANAVNFTFAGNVTASNLSGTNTGDQNVGTDTHNATAKTTPVDADEFPIADSAASYLLKKLTWANLKAALPAATTSTAGTLSANDYAALQSLKHAAFGGM